MQLASEITVRKRSNACDADDRGKAEFACTVHTLSRTQHFCLPNLRRYRRCNLQPWQPSSHYRCWLTATVGIRCAATRRSQYHVHLVAEHDLPCTFSICGGENNALQCRHSRAGLRRALLNRFSLGMAVHRILRRIRFAPVVGQRGSVHGELDAGVRHTRCVVSQLNQAILSFFSDSRVFAALGDSVIVSLCLLVGDGDGHTRLCVHRTPCV